MNKLKSSDIMKKQNIKNILRVINDERGIHRKLVAKKTNLATQTVTNLVSELCDQNILSEYKNNNNQKGRSPISLLINYQHFHIVTVVVSVKSVKVFLNGLDGSVVYESESQLNKLIDPLFVIKKALCKIKNQYKMAKYAVVISVEGVVNEELGLVIEAKDIGWKNLDLKKELAEYETPVFVCNDVSIIAYYEKFRVKDEMNSMIVKLDSGIGSSFILGQNILKSKNSVAGELGHYTVENNEEEVKCVCGKRNCLTQFISKTAIVKRYGKSYRELQEDIDNQVPEAIEFIENLCEMLGRVLANIITLLDLERVVLTGGIIEDFENIMYGRLQTIVQENISYWVSFKTLEIHKNISPTVISSKFILDYYFNVNDTELFLWDINLINRGEDGCVYF